MTDLKFAILKILYEKYPVREENKSVFINPEFANPTLVKYSLEELEDRKYIKSILGSDKYELTSSGANAFEDAQEERNRTTERKKQQMFTKIIAIVSTAIALLETLYIVLT